MSSRRAAAILIAAVLALTAPAGAAPGAASEDDLFRQVKVDVFDQKWPDVLRGCDEILTRYPGGASAPQAAFYRARALGKIPGREPDGIRAFRDFLAKNPADRVLREEAWASLFTVACEPRAAAAKPACVAALRDGLASGSRYVSTLAAIRASDTQDAALRRSALTRLKDAHATETDPEIRNEILIAILKIDPKQVPPAESVAPPAAPTARGPAPAGKPPSLIRMTVFNKEEGKYELKINLPVSFARMLIDSVDEDKKTEMRKEAREKGIDLDDIFQAIQKSGAGKLLEVDDASVHIEIWIE